MITQEQEEALDELLDILGRFFPAAKTHRWVIKQLVRFNDKLISLIVEWMKKWTPKL